MELFQINRFLDNKLVEYKNYNLIKFSFKFLLFLGLFLSFKYIENNNILLKNNIIKYHYIDYQETNLLHFKRSL